MDPALAMVVFYLGFGPGVIAHEAGHALAAWLLRLSPRFISIGIGPVLLRARLGKTWLVMRLVPLSGFVAILPLMRERRLASAMMFLAGAGSNAVSFSMLAAASHVWPEQGEVLWFLALAQAFFIFFPLIPFRTTVSGLSCGTDGLRLLWLLSRSRPDVLAEAHSELLRLVIPEGARLPPPSANFPEIAYQMGRPDRSSDAWAQRDAAEVLRGMLSRNDLPTAERAVVLVDLIEGELLNTRGADPALLDSWSLEAVALSPVPRQRALRSAVLTALGRAEEAADAEAPLSLLCPGSRHAR